MKAGLLGCFTAACRVGAAARFTWWQRLNQCLMTHGLAYHKTTSKKLLVNGENSYMDA